MARALGGAAIVIAARLAPAALYDPGIDLLGSRTGPLEIEILANPFGLPSGTYITNSLEGFTTVERSYPNSLDADGDNDGLVDIRTRMLAFEQQGAIAGLGLGIRTHLNSGVQTLGVIEQAGPTSLFPANSFFDVFFELEVDGLPFRLFNQDALRMEQTIESIPPVTGTVYQNKQQALPWWPTNILDTGYPAGAALPPMPLELYVNAAGLGIVHVANLKGHPTHTVAVPEAGTGIASLLLGALALGIRPRRVDFARL